LDESLALSADYPRGLWVDTPLYDRATYERTGPREASVVYVGLDVHKDSIVIAVAREGREAAENWKTIPNDAVRLQKALKLLKRRCNVRFERVSG